MLVSSIGSAQTFDFSCGGPDVNGITTHDGFEVSDDFDNVYENPSYPSITLDYITHGNPKVPGIQIQISTVITQTFLTGTSQEVYDLSVAWVLENRSPIPTQTCTPTLSIAEGVVLNSPGHANDGALINGIIIRDPSSVLVTYLPGDELPMDFTEYEFRINTHFGRSRVTNIYDGSCELVINGTTDNVSAPACTPTLSIAEGAVFDEIDQDRFPITGLFIDNKIYPNGSDLPTGEFEYRLHTTQGGGAILAFFWNPSEGGYSRTHDGSCELIINGDTDNVNIMEVVETGVINVPEEFRDRFAYITFNKNGVRVSKEDGTQQFTNGETIPDTDTYSIVINNNNGELEVLGETFRTYTGGDINITADIFPNVINIPEALNPWIQRITFQDIQNNSIKHTPDVGGNETNIYDDGDFIPEEATHYRIRIRQTLGTNNGSYDTEQISVPSSGDLNICLSVLDIADGLIAAHNNTPIVGIIINDVDQTRYRDGDIIPSGTRLYDVALLSPDNGPAPAGRYNLAQSCGTITVDVAVNLTNQTSLAIDLTTLVNNGDDLSGHTYNLAGKTYTISNESSGQYRFTPNSGNVIFVDKAGLTASGGRIAFGKVDLWNSNGHALTTNGTDELERAIPLIEVGVKIFYPSGRGNYNSIRNGEPLFAIESDFLVTDAANMNKNIIDLTPVNGITVFPGDENAITSGSDFSALVTESRYYAYVLTNNKIGVGLVTGSGASLVITDTENNLKIGSARGGTLLWEINGPRRINDVGEFKYIKVVNQRNSSWHNVEGYYRIHPAINGGFTDQTSASYQAAATSGNLTVVTTVDPDMISEQAEPGDFFVIRDNSIDRQGFTVAYARSRQTAGLVYGLIFSFGAPNLGSSLNFNVGHAQKLTNTPVLQ